MKFSSTLTGATVGALVAIAGLALMDYGTDGATAAADDPVTQADLKAANDRSIRAIKQGTSVWNMVGKYLADKDTLISLQTPRISQQAGTGGGGLPGSIIKDGAITATKLADASVTEAKLGNASVTTTKLGDASITEAKLSAALQAKLPRWVTKTDNGANATGRASSTDYAVVRVGPGNYRADFGDTDVTACSWTAVPSTDTGLPDSYEVRTALDVSDSTRVVVRTYDSTGAIVESGWQAQVFC